MSLDLSTLKFSTDTTELDTAVKKIETLGKSVEGLASSLGKLDKETVAAAKSQAQANVVNAKAEVIQAKANTENAKAALVQSKINTENTKAALIQEKVNDSLEKTNKTVAQSNLINAKATTEAAKVVTENAKAQAIATKAIEATEAANRRLTKVVKEKQSVEERQAAITRLMSDGYSRGQASILATAEAAGEATVRLGELLKTQRAMSGQSPFDKTLGAATVFANELRVLTVANDLYNQDLGFTKNQLMELGREHVRMTEQFKIQGKSLTGLDAEFNSVVQSAQKVTQAENAMATSMKNADKATIDAGKANAYIENELQKVRFALQANNEELNRSTSNSLVRFENALKKSGLTLDQQKVKIDEYRKAQVELQKTTSSNQTDYITRAVGPQITDIIVGLSTGQSPLTVMMQQGGQLRDQFGMMGIAAKDMGDVMRNAMKGMAQSVFDTGKAIGGMLVGGVYDASKAALNYVTNLTGVNDVLERTKYHLTLAKNEGSAFAGTLLKGLTFLGGVLTGVLAIALVTTIAAFVAFGVAINQVIEEESKLSKALNLTGASLGFTKDSAVAYASSMKDVGATTSQGIEVITAMAKTGIIGADSIRMVTEAAVLMEKYAGVAIEDTVKAFEKMKEKPVESMVELAKATGTITPETIKLIYELESQGKTAEVAAIAMKALADANSSAAKRIQEDLHPLQQLYMGIGDGIKYMWNSFKDLTRSDPSAMLSKAYERLASYQINPKAHAANIEAERILISQLSAKLRLEGEGVRLRQEQSIASANTAKWEDIKLKNLSSEKKEATEIAKIREAGAKAGILEAEIQQQINAVIAKRPKAKKEAEVKLTQEQKDIIKGLEERVDLENKVLGLNKEYNNQMYRANLLFESGNSSQEQRQKSFEAIEKAQPRYTASLAAQKKLTEDMKKDTESILKLKEDSTKFLVDENNKTQDITSGYALRLALLGKTEEQQKVITQEAELQKKLAESNNEFEKQRIKLLDDYEKAKRTANNESTVLTLEKDKDAAILALIVARAERERAINQETAVLAKESIQKEFDAIKSSITDSIVTALFDGGKAGSKKLRDQVVAAFRNKITVVIDAVVNTALQGGMNALGIGKGAGGLMSGVGTAANLYSMGSATFGGLSSGATSIGSILSATGASVGTAATYGTAIGSAQTAMLAAQEAGMGLAGAANGITAALGSIPVWGWLAMGGLALAGALQGGETRSGGQYVSTATSGASLVSGPSGGEISGDVARQMLDVTQLGINAMFKAVGSTATIAAFTAGLESSESGKGFAYAGGTLSTGAKFGDVNSYMNNRGDKTPEEAMAAYKTELLQATIGALKAASDIPKTIQDIIGDTDIGALTEAAGTALMTQISSVITVVDSFKSSLLTLPFEYLKNLSFDTAAGLIAAGGGLESLMGNLSGFYDNFYTETEKTAYLTATTSKAFADLNIVMPAINEKTRDWYRSEVEKLGVMDLSVEANANAYASVLSLQGSVNQLAPTFDSVAQSAAEAAANMTSAWANIMQARGVSSAEVTRFTAQASISGAFAEYKKTDKAGIASASQFTTISQDDFKAYSSEQQQLISTIISGFASIDSTYKDNIETVQNLNNSYTPYVESIKEVEIEIDKSIQATADYQMAMWEATGDTVSAAIRQRELATATKLAAGWTQSQIDNLYGAQEAAVVLKQQKEQQDLVTQATKDYQLAIWEATGDTASAALRQRELATATKLAAGWTQSQIDNLYGAQEAAEAKAKADAGIKAADEQRASNSNSLLSVLTDTAALTNDVVLAESMLNLQRVKQLIELRKADPSGELANATFNLWKLQDAAKATADLKAKEEVRTKVQSDFSRALLDAAGNSSGLAEFDRRLSDAALVAAGWTDAQVQSVNATRANTEAKAKADADLKAQVQIQSDYNKALLEASGDSSGLDAFNQKLSDAALVAAGWTETQVKAVNTARANTEAKAKADADLKAQVQIQSDYNKALLEASGDTSGLAAFDRKLSDAALVAAGWTQVQVDAVNTARASTEAKAKADALVQVQSDYNRALLEASGDTSGLAAFERKLSDAALITSGWTASMVLAVNEARAKAEADLKSKEQAQIQSDYNRALLEASGDTSGLAAFDRKLSDAALIAAGWTDVQVKAVNAARLKTEADTKAQEALKAWGATMQSLADIKGNLQVDLMTAQGRTGDADALRRQLDLAPMTLGTSGTESSAITSAYDFNDQLRKQIATANTNKDLSNQLSILLGTQTERTIALGAATDATTKSLMNQVWAQQDAKAQADERKGLTNQLLQLQGKTSELRNREILGINASNRALQRRIWALQDEAQAQSVFDAASSAITQNYITANQELAQAQSAITDLTNQSADSMRGFSESIRDFLKSLETTALGSSSPESRYRALQAEFSSVSQAASTGNVAALGKLAGVASDFLTSSKEYFATGTGFILDESMVKRILGEIQLSTSRASAAALQGQDPAAKAQLELARAMASVANANEMIRVTGVATSVATTDLLTDFRKAQENLLLAQEEAKIWKAADDLLQLNQTTAVTDTALAITEVLNPTTANIDVGVTTLNSTLTVSNNYLAAIQISSDNSSKNSKDAYIVLESLNVQLVELNAKNAFLNSEVSSLRSKVTSMESNQRLSASAPVPVQ